MKEVILIKLGEIVLKGLNRKNFEDRLVKSIKYRLHSIGAFTVRNSQSIITVTPLDENAETYFAVVTVYQGADKTTSVLETIDFTAAE